MKFRIVLILATVLILGCKKEKNTTVPLLDYIPKNSSIVIKINDLNVFRSEIKNNDFINKLRETGTYKTISDKLKGLGHLQTSGESLLAFSEMGRENFEFTYVATKSPDLFTLDNVADKAIETLIYENKNFIKYTLEGAIFYSMEIDDKVVISSSQLLLENLVRNKGSIKKHPTFQQLYKVSNTGKSASVFVHSSNNNSLLVSSLVESSPVEISQFADWISLDLNMGQEYIRLNGLGIANDSLKNYVNLFKDTRPMANTTPSFAPLNANGILSHTFDDYGKFAKNQQSYLDRSTVMDTIFNTVEEIGFIYMSGEKAVILNTYGSANISEFLDGLRKTSF
ncbi:MAG: ribonuclease HII, partial [Bacteroidota bacterium]